VTISAGVASALPTGDGDPAALVERADRALYEAKADGRNRVVRAASPLPPSCFETGLEEF
jgi:two-component system cell cycle response regulator